MEKTFSPQAVETHWYQQWEKSGYFVPQGDGAAYCIMIPPPNVTGVLHMGHAFQSAIQDALIRYHRMCGKKVLWQVGIDHAGIATQMVVERQLEKENITKQQLGRAEFTKRIWQWKEYSGNEITQQFRRMGISVDWQRERFTLDPGLSRAVLEVFVRLYRDDFIYRGQRLVNWDPKLQTAISDLEVIMHEEDGFLWHIHYPKIDGTEGLTVATTRPETLLGDVAVAVHPNDVRYQHLIGKMLQLPLCDRAIPVIADTAVEPEFGTGCVKITPAHDFNDYEMGLRHRLPMINIFDSKAHINHNAPLAYQGLSREVARETILKDLQQHLRKTEKYTRKTPRGEKSGVIVEPYLTQQWFVKMKTIATPAIAAVRKGDVRFVPENWQKTYFQWLENIEDWCISRQLWWGHRIPAWYDGENNIYVGYDEAEVRTYYGLSHDVVLTQDEDVLDTWFSSALWPFSTLGWPEKTPDLKTFYPTNVLVTGFDIIFFWVARIMMMGLHFMQDIPFHDVYITPLIRDHEGKKMSKSKGNVLDPLDIVDGISLENLIAKNTAALMQDSLKEKIIANTRKQFPDGIQAHGTDALRFMLCHIASPGKDVSFDLTRVESARLFTNKLWNAARFVLMNTENHEVIVPHPEQLSRVDVAIRSQLQRLIQDAHHYFADYRLDLLAARLYDFIWHEFCDWSLELAKITLQNDDLAIQNAARYALLSNLEILLRLLHPLMPFITEEIWQSLSRPLKIDRPTIMLEAYPKEDMHFIDVSAEADIDWIKQTVTAIRTMRAEMRINPSQMISALWQCNDAATKNRLLQFSAHLKALGKISEIKPLSGEAPAAATVVVDNVQWLFPLSDFIDAKAEKHRLEKEIKKINIELLALQSKLSNQGFLAKAPLDVVEKEKARLQSLQDTLTALQEKL